MKEPSFNTQAIRGGFNRSSEQEHSEPIFTTSSFVFESAEEAAKKFSGEREGNTYSRFSNPTLQTFERRLALLEGAERCIATSSGMAAILSVCMALLQSGDHIVASRSLFGTTTSLFADHLSRFGVKTTFVAPCDYDAWEAALTKNTRMLFLETPSNPLNEVIDIQRVADISHTVNAYLVVDNCFCTPAIQQPLALGADIIVHSATKYLDGQGRCMGGAVLGSHKDMEAVFGFLRAGGPCMSPFNAWVFTKGLETLSIRMTAQSANALALAQWLEQQPQVTQVYYCGLPSHPTHDIAKKQQKDFGAVISFEVSGGQKAAWHLIDSTQLISITGNLGDTKTTITHPATTTHQRLAPELKQLVGITDGLVRIAVGLEAVEDIIQDLMPGLKGQG